MNKNIKLLLNYTIGIGLAAVLAYALYTQITAQLKKLDGTAWYEHGSWQWLMLALLAGLGNLGMEVVKWRYLVNRSDYISWWDALKSFLTGLALSFITPNRIGEYPGRLLALEKKNTVRLISLSILGAFAQMFITIIVGNVGLWYYFQYLHTGPTLWWWLLPANVLLSVLLLFFFLRFEKFAGMLEHIKWLRKAFTYRRIIQRVQLQQQCNILLISLTRYLFFTAELLLLLYFFKAEMPYPQAIFLSILFFWAMTVIPSFAIAELGIRGSVGLYLFGMFTQNNIGILLATFALWIINLLLPALLGSILVVRKRWIH